MYINTKFNSSTLDNVRYLGSKFNNVTFDRMIMNHVTFEDGAIFDCTFSDVRSSRTYFLLVIALEFTKLLRDLIYVELNRFLLSFIF